MVAHHLCTALLHDGDDDDEEEDEDARSFPLQCTTVVFLTAKGEITM